MVSTSMCQLKELAAPAWQELISLPISASMPALPALKLAQGSQKHGSGAQHKEIVGSPSTEDESKS